MLLFFDGFEIVQDARKPEWQSGNDMRYQPGRGAGNGLSGNGGTGPQLNLPADCNTIFVGAAIRCESGVRGNTTSKLLSVGRDSTAYLTVNLDATGHLLLRSGGANGTILATSTAVFPNVTWQSVQLQATPHTSTGTAKVYVEGTEVINFTGATAPANNPFNKLWLQTHDLWQVIWDDLWVCNEVDGTSTQGRPNNSLLGDLKVSYLLPNGNGAYSQMVGVDGNSVDNYLYADEFRGDHYNGSPTIGNRDTYTMQDLPSAAVDVLGVQRIMYAWKSDAGSAALKPVLREGDGTVTVGSPVTLSTTPTVTYESARYASPSGDAWTVTDINNIQVGGEVA